MNKIFKVLFAFILGMILLLIYRYPSYCFSVFGSCYFVGEPIMRLSLSEDGRYIISSDNKGWVTLWDIEKKTKQLISEKAGVYGVGWVEGRNLFYWQDRDTYQIQVQNLKGDVVKTFNSGAQIFGSALSSDLKYYAQGVLNQQGCYYFVMNLEENEPPYHPPNRGRYVLCGWNPYHFQFLPEERLFFSNDIFLLTKIDNTLDTRLKHIVSYDGTIGTAFATLSPDRQYVIGGDEQSVDHVFTWNTLTGNQVSRLYSLHFGWTIKAKAGEEGAIKELDGSYSKWDDSVLRVKHPTDYIDKKMGYPKSLAIRFVDKTHYLLLGTFTHYAVLYDLLDPAALKYFDLGKSPMPGVNDFERDLANDSSWQAHIFAIAKEDEGGILVYRYDPEKQTLTKIWDAR